MYQEQLGLENQDNQRGSWAGEHRHWLPEGPSMIGAQEGRSFQPVIKAEQSWGEEQSGDEPLR